MSSKIINIQEKNNDYLLAKQGVEGTAIGEKWVDGRPTGEKAILVFVQKKHSVKAINNPKVLTSFTADDLIPDKIDGVATDVIEVGHIKKQAEFVSRVRPLQPGFSCGHGSISAGTIGGIFLDKHNKPVILSNNHVLANENKSKVGENIYQPGPTDSKINKSNIIGRLTKFVRLRSANNIQDSAIARIDPQLIATNQINDIYPHINQRLKGFGSVSIGQSVQKCGRTTGYTTGRVLGVNASFGVQYDFGIARFNQCIVISAMSKGGDSGSVIQDMAGNAVGLLFAGSNKVTIANPMNIVQDFYGLKLYSEVATDSYRFDDNQWKLIKSDDASVKITSNQFHISALKNNYCYIETPIKDFSEISCEVNTGTDIGAAWAPGISVHWPNGFIKLNLRHGSTFGGYTHLDTNFDAGRVKPNTTYGLRIKLVDNIYIGEVQDNGAWIKVIEVPKTMLPNSPILVKLGKSDIKAENRQHHLLGSLGSSVISNYRII